MHFLKKLIQSPTLEDPARSHKEIHRHFYKYSKGDFLGPVLKITKTKSKITLKGSYEYEDLIQEVVATTISQDNIEIKGVLITSEDISDLIIGSGLDWKLKKSSGKKKNYQTNILDTISKNTLIEIIEKFRETSYFLLSFNLNPMCKVFTKTRIPHPSKNKIKENNNINKRIQFCTGVINNSEKNIELVINLALEDFKSDLPEHWKNIIVINNYKIDKIVLPKGINDSRMLRIMSIRKGKIIRSIDVDGNCIEKQYSIVV